MGSAISYLAKQVGSFLSNGVGAKPSRTCTASYGVILFFQNTNSEVLKQQYRDSNMARSDDTLPTSSIVSGQGHKLDRS